MHEKIRKIGNILKRSWIVDILAFVFCIGYLAVGILTLPQFGLTWDEGLGNLFYGHRYFYYFTSLNQKYLDYTITLEIDSIDGVDLSRSVIRDASFAFPPLADTLSAVTMHVFSVSLNWLDPVDGFHLFKVGLASVLLWILYRNITPRFDKLTGWTAMLFLGLFPRFWADMHFNPKDIPTLIVFAFTVFAYIDWFEKSDKLNFKSAVPGSLLVGVLFGAGLAIKANIVFLVPILLLGIIPWSIDYKKWQATIKHFKKFWAHYFLMACVGLFIYAGSWPPYENGGPLIRISKYWESMFQLGTGAAYFAPKKLGLGSLINKEPLWQVYGTTPEVMLVFLVAGLIFIFRNIKANQSAFDKTLLIWLFFPIFRVSFPNMHNFDGIRHFMEYVPAAAIIAGYGAACCIKLLNQIYGFRYSVTTGVVILAMLLNIADASRIYYPYLHLYYNRISGGLSEAQKLGYDGAGTDYWASSYRQGLEWINSNAEPQAQLMIPVGWWIVDITANQWLRSDITVVPLKKGINGLISSNKTSYLMFITRPGFYNGVTTYCIENLHPIHEIVVDGVSILSIYRLENFD